MTCYSAASSFLNIRNYSGLCFLANVTLRKLVVLGGFWCQVIWWNVVASRESSWTQVGTNIQKEGVPKRCQQNDRKNAPKGHAPLCDFCETGGSYKSPNQRAQGDHSGAFYHCTSCKARWRICKINESTFIFISTSFIKQVSIEDC